MECSFLVRVFYVHNFWLNLDDSGALRILIEFVMDKPARYRCLAYILISNDNDFEIVIWTNLIFHVHIIACVLKFHVYLSLFIILTDKAS